MRALWLVRRNLTLHPGGDTTQILQTARALAALGVTVDLSDDAHPDLSGYDVVHLFHLDRLWENEPHCRRIRAQGRPAVLSPIYWPGEAFDRGGRVGLQGLMARTLGSETYRSLRLLQRWALGCATRLDPDGWPAPTLSFRRAARFVLRTVAVLLPNSLAEQRVIERSLGAAPAVVVVPNAPALTVDDPPLPAPERRSGVLCVGRIEPRKNQLALIRALRGAGIALRLVGQAGRFNARYLDRCRREAGSDVAFLGQRRPNELAELYSAARVHASVSWYETPGLASLEAALLGCAVVATHGGCTTEYLGEDAHYCRPDDVDSIRGAVEAAMARGASSCLADRVARKYTWQVAAGRTLDAYRLAVAGRA